MTSKSSQVTTSLPSPLLPHHFASATQRTPIGPGSGRTRSCQGCGIFHRQNPGGTTCMSNPRSQSLGIWRGAEAHALQLCRECLRCCGLSSPHLLRPSKFFRLVFCCGQLCELGTVVSASKSPSHAVESRATKTWPHPPSVVQSSSLFEEAASTTLRSSLC